MKLEIGRFYLLLGRNGSGKTTLLKIMAGLLKPDRGIIRIFGREMEDTTELKIHTGYVFQNPITQIIGSTVEEDLAFGLENMGVDPEEMERRIESILEFVELKDHRCSDPMTLSGGQIQRLAIASILILEPDVLLLDEPLGMLDMDGRREVVQLMRKMKDEGKTIVLATHDLDDLDFADGVIYIDSGRAVVMDVGEFFSTPREDVPKPGWISG